MVSCTNETFRLCEKEITKSCSLHRKHFLLRSVLTEANKKGDVGMGEIILKMQGIQKYFSGVHALNGVNFEL